MYGNVIFEQTTLAGDNEGNPRYYLTLRELGAGGSGAVYSAVEVSGGEKFVISELLAKKRGDMSSEDKRQVSRFLARKSTHVLKVVEAEEGMEAEEELSYIRHVARREIRINDAMKVFDATQRRPLICKTAAECMVVSFLTTLPRSTRKAMILLFPFTSDTSLAYYLDNTHHPEDSKRRNVESRRKWLYTCTCISLMLIELVRAVHALGLVHHDIKPDNILVLFDADKNVESLRFIDFGLSCFVELPTGSRAQELAKNIFDVENSSNASLSATIGCWGGNDTVTYASTEGFDDPRSMNKTPDPLKYVSLDDPRREISFAKDDSRLVAFPKRYVAATFRLFDAYAACVTIAIIFSENFQTLNYRDPDVGLYANGTIASEVFILQYKLLSRAFALVTTNENLPDDERFSSTNTNAYAVPSQIATILRQLKRSLSS